MYDLTDNLPNFLIIKNISFLSNNIKKYKRDYSNFNETSLTKDIQSNDREEVLNENPDPNTMFDSFHT